MLTRLINSENKNVYIRRAIFAAALLVIAALQNTDGLLPEIFGARPMLLIPAVVCIAMFEREIPGMMFGLFAGMLWDVSSVSGGSFNAILLTATGFACGTLIAHLMRNNLVTALLLSSVVTVLYQGIYWLRMCIFSGGSAVSLFTFYIPSCIYTLLWLPVFYLLARLAMRRLVRK